MSGRETHARGTLRAIVAAMGGDLYDGGRRANIPAPGHTAADRSVSLLLREGRVIIHGFGAADWRSVRDELWRRGLINAAQESSDGPLVARAAPAQTPDGRQRLAEALWESGTPARPGSTAVRHARLRAIRRSLEGIADLRAHSAAPLSVYRGSGRRQAALLAAIRNPVGELTAVEVTYLKADGRRADDLRLPRKTVGVLPAGSAVRLDPAAAHLLVAEGVFTALSAGERFRLPAWALLSAGALRRWTPPPYVRRVLIAGDRGTVGEAAAAELATRLRTAGIRAMVALPPPPFSDWNDVAQAGEGRRGR